MSFVNSFSTLSGTYLSSTVVMLKSLSEMSDSLSVILVSWSDTSPSIVRMSVSLSVILVS